MTTDIYVSIGIFLGLVLVTILFLSTILLIINERIARKRCDDFTEDIVTALNKFDISWNQAKQFAETRSLSLKDIRESLAVLNRDILTGKYPDLEDQADAVQHMIDMYDNETPFEGLPASLRTPLERLSNILNNTGEGTEELDPLVEQIRQYSDDNIRVKKRQQIWTKVGFLLTALGVALSVWPLFK